MQHEGKDQRNEALGREERSLKDMSVISEPESTMIGFSRPTKELTVVALAPKNEQPGGRAMNFFM